MSPSSIIPEIREKLNPISNRLAWLSQQEAERMATLPATPDGKTNVRQLVRDLGLRETLEQRFYLKPGLGGPVSALASVQGL